MEIIAYKDRFFSVFVDGFVPHFALLCTVVQQPPYSVIFEISRSNRMMAAILSLLLRWDQEDGYLKKVHSLANGQTVTKYSAIKFPKF